VPGSNGRPPACKARAGAAVCCRLSLRPLDERGSAPTCCALLRFAASKPLPDALQPRESAGGFMRHRQGSGSGPLLLFIQGSSDRRVELPRPDRRFRRGAALSTWAPARRPARARRQPQPARLWSTGGANSAGYVPSARRCCLSAEPLEGRSTAQRAVLSAIGDWRRCAACYCGLVYERATGVLECVRER
jgi:hypothetical protein